MYRRVIRKPPPPVFPTDLAGFGYTLNDKSRLVDAEGKEYTFNLKAKNRDYEEAHGRALCDVVVQIMVKRMEEEFGLVRKIVPLGFSPEDTTLPHAHILLTPDYNECKRLLVLSPGTMESLGSWSRRLVCNYSAEDGSMFAVVKMAIDQGFGVVILNSNAQYWVNGQTTYMTPTNPRGIVLVPELESPEKHVSYVLKNIIQPAASREIFFIGHKYGCHSLMQALNEQFNELKDRVSAIAMIESTASINKEFSKDFRKWWSSNAVDYTQSEAEEAADKGEVEYNTHRGCNCVRMGMGEFDQTILVAMPFILRFFKSRLNRDNVFDHYKELVFPPVKDDPTTVLITFDADELEDDDSEPAFDENLDPSWG
ncbi:hypothetical protein EMPS_08518 [Entomortierella parvispora]|uniref:Arb2 domain-containing protein n=1 Tax=Entomortierella parvispora TaxID=205924 RepID=A0A9P3HG59_9FUNG|nr:hypothetical protein EMPS_08518 [Entomortierella parvispora]